MNTFFHTLFLFTLYYCISFAHDCDHDNIEQDIRFLDIEEDMSTLDQGRALTSNNYPNIRIYAYYDFLKKTASPSFSAYIENQLIPPIVDYFQSALKVKFPVSGNLKLNLDVGSICEQATPMVLRGAGVPADFFIYYDSEVFIDSAQIANTKYCYLSSGTKRPLIARTIINRNTLSMANGDVLLHEKNIYVLMHEMVHGLGFSSSTFKLFIDANGKPLKGHIKSAKMNGITRIFLDVSPLTQKLRNHFGCPSLEGALLENNGGTDTAGSHFERKMFLYEAMTSGNMIGRRISELSLALLEGSGWYIPDYNYAEPFFFGKGQGCSFVTCSNCTNFEEFCSGSGNGCSAHGRGAGFCRSDSASDSCKYYSPTTDYDCENENGGAFSRLPELQTYGAGRSSKCFAGTLNSLNSESSNGLTTFCFKYICSGSGTDTKLQVLVGNQQVDCAEEGTVTVDGYYGSVNCPDPLAFCNTVGLKYCPRNCMGRGTCVDGVCQCRSGYSGVDCALNNCW